jgi:hemoglobin
MAHPKALAARAAAQENAADLGIDPDFISELVETFYVRVRAHPILGPVFENAIGPDWDAHLSKMKDFWSSVALHTGQYSGKPVLAHQQVQGIEPWHFGIWLGLFAQTAKDLCTSAETADFFQERAERIAQSLKLALFFDPAKATPK